jgi:hypothetical protein
MCAGTTGFIPSSAACVAAVAVSCISSVVYLEGQAMRRDQLSRDAQGARAVLNALARIADSYDDVRESIGRDRALAVQQLADYQARLGKVFAHTTYQDELTVLRDRLKAALSDAPKEGEPTAAELAEQIKALRASHTAEAAPIRKQKQVAATVPAPQPLPPPEQPSKETPPSPADDEDSGPGEAPPAIFQHRVRGKSIQQSLF